MQLLIEHGIPFTQTENRTRDRFEIYFQQIVCHKLYLNIYIHIMVYVQNFK